MKYAKFEKLDLILKQQNSSLNQFVKEVTGKSLPINEETVPGATDLMDLTQSLVSMTETTSVEQVNNTRTQKKQGDGVETDETTAVKKKSTSTGNISMQPLKIEKLDFKGEGMKQFKKLLTSPKTALNMRRIVKAARRLEANIQEKLVDKFYPKIMEGQKNVLMQVLQLQQQGQNSEEIVDHLQESLKSAKQASASMLKQLSSAVQKMVDNATKRITSHIEGLDIKDLNKERLENLWLMAGTGIMENFFASVINNQTEFINTNVKDPQIKKILASISNIKAAKAAQAKIEEKEKAEKKEGEGGNQQGNETKIK